ncbi:decarboxylase [Streptomyces sp. WZ.A104]|uniref:alanine racemase n=1 Tax=Streptomyces sp. WZ.A104 TaxID=2023771 RepID=UPI000BBBC71F|nr:alanine racemase [Streptomyces sp. WZ.A104]PCG84206.1 decarboxylase [Streptomyces sp. WZ.A104]
MTSPPAGPSAATASGTAGAEPAGLDPRERRALLDLGARFGTPLYVLRLDRVRDAAARLRAALPEESRLCYSLKANPDPHVVSVLARAGLAAEVSSTGELDVALRAGFAPEDFLYTGPGKTAAEITAALGAGVRLFSVESVADYRRVARLSAGAGTTARCLVRLNAGGASGAGLRMTGKPSQFGMDQRELGELLAARSDHLEIVGTHLFAGTNIEGEAALLAEFAAAAEATASARKRLGLTGGIADLGGGFAAPYARPGSPAGYPSLRVELEKVLDRTLPGWREGSPAVAFESGRALTGDSGTLLSSVTDVKTSHDTVYVVLDAGTNVLGGMAGLGRLMTAGVRAEPLDDAEQSCEERPTVLVGPLCTPLDVLARRHVMRPPAVDSLLAVPNTGAYGLHASLLGFLSRPLPGCVVLDGDDVVSASRLELVARPLPDRQAEGTGE